MSKTLNEIREALFATGLVQPVSSSCRGGRLEVMCRQVPGQEGPWLKTIDRILSLSDSAPELEKSIHICRRYVRRDSRMVFGWHIGICAEKAKGLEEIVRQILPILTEAKPTLTPMVHTGSSPSQNRSSVSSENPGNTIRTIQSTIDDNGKRHVIQEMPLPHVTRELNVPNAKGKGARKTASI